MLDRFRRHDETLPAVHFKPLGELRVVADERAAGARDLHERIAKLTGPRRGEWSPHACNRYRGNTAEGIGSGRRWPNDRAQSSR